MRAREKRVEGRQNVSKSRREGYISVMFKHGHVYIKIVMLC